MVTKHAGFFVINQDDKDTTKDMAKNIKIVRASHFKANSAITKSPRSDKNELAPVSSIR